MKLLEALEWRYATKLFDKSYKLTNEELELLKDVIRLSASSYGLQPYKVVIIKDEELKAKLKPVSNNQEQITSCSHLFVFCTLKTISEKYISEYSELKGTTLNLDQDRISGMKNYMISIINNKSESEQENWTAKQAYIALGNLLAGCAELGLDSCPMEGFDIKGYNDILNIEEDYTVAVITAVGKRSEEDKYQYLKKVRKPENRIFELR